LHNLRFEDHISIPHSRIANGGNVQLVRLAVASPDVAGVVAGTRLTVLAAVVIAAGFYEKDRAD
jgi:hypothetical protein